MSQEEKGDMDPPDPPVYTPMLALTWQRKSVVAPEVGNQISVEEVPSQDTMFTFKNMLNIPKH